MLKFVLFFVSVCLVRDTGKPDKKVVKEVRRMNRAHDALTYRAFLFRESPDSERSSVRKLRTLFHPQFYCVETVPATHSGRYGKEQVEGMGYPSVALTTNNIPKCWKKCKRELLLEFTHF